MRQSLIPQIERLSTKEQHPRYGFQFWTFTENINEKDIAISEAKGNGGQRIFFCRNPDLVVVITAGNYNNRDIKNGSREVLVKYILHAIK